MSNRKLPLPKCKEKVNAKEKRKKNGEYSKEMLEVADELVKKKTLSSYEAEKQFGIPRRTILDKVNNKHTNHVGCPTRLSSHEEKQIVKVLITAGEYGSPLTLLDLRVVVHRYLTINGRESSFNGKPPGKKWALSFVERHRKSLTLRSTQNIKRARAEKTNDEIQYYFNNLKSSMANVPPENIVNYDETNFSDNPGATKCLFRRGVKYPERVLNHSKGCISVMFSITASGECLPPYVIYKSEHLWEQWCSNGPDGTRYNRTNSGWLDMATFEEWFVTVVLPWARKKEGPKLLIGDNLASHISVRVVELCEQYNIRFTLLPPNSSHITQPLDVCFFRPMKGKWRNVLLEYKIKNPSETTLNKSHFPMLLRSLMESVNDKKKHTIFNAFRSTGIHPFNPHKVLKKLPDYEESTSYDVDNALLDYLKECRTPKPTQKVRNKKLKVEPGVSISSEDIIHMRSTKQKPSHPKDKKVKKTIPKNQTRNASKSVPGSPPKSISCNSTKENANNNEGSIKENISPNTIDDSKHEPGPSSKSLPWIDPEFEIETKGYNTDKCRTDTDYWDKILESNINAVIADAIEATEKRKKPTKKDIKQELSSDNSDMSVSRFSLLDLSNEEFTISSEEEDISKQEDILIEETAGDCGLNSFVLVKFETSKTTKYYIGQITEINCNCFRVKYLRNRGKGKFGWPLVEDSSVVYLTDIEKVLPTPKVGRRGLLVFNANLKIYTIL